MNQIPGVHDGSTRAEIHGSAYHVIVITYPDPVIVRNIGIGQGIDTFSLLILSSTS